MSLLPSKIIDRYWIYSINESYQFKRPKEQRRSGKWLIFDDIAAIDRIWEMIDLSTKSGLLGPSAKVSTSKENKNASDPNTRVICVFTENYDDKSDVHRIKTALRELGITNKLLYKLDKNIGQYEKDGHRNLIEEVSYSEAFYQALNLIQKEGGYDVFDEGHRKIVVYRKGNISKALLDQQQSLNRLGIYLSEQK